MSQRNCPTSLAVEIVETRNHFALTASRPQNTQARFHRCGTAVVELKTVQIARQYLGHLFYQTSFNLRREIMAVHQLTGIFLHSPCNLRMTMPQRRNINPRRKVDVSISVGINECASVARFERYRKQLHLTAQTLKILSAARMKFF